MGFVEKTHFYDQQYCDQLVDSSRAAELEHFLWLFGFRDVCSPDFMFLGQTLKSAVVSTLNLLYEAKFLEIKKD